MISHYQIKKSVLNPNGTEANVLSVVAMYTIGLHSTILQIFQYFEWIGLWYRVNDGGVKATCVKIFYSIFYLLFVVSIFGGAIATDNSDEAIFMLLATIMIIVILTKLLHIIWKKNDIVELMGQMCVHSIEHQSEFDDINTDLNGKMKFIKVFWYVSYFEAIIATTIAPFVTKERELFLNIAFPLDWKNNEIGFWAGFFFIIAEAILTTTAILFSVIESYLMMNCKIKYDVLGNRLRNLGAIPESQRKISQREKENLYLRDLVAAIESFEEINRLP